MHIRPATFLVLFVASSAAAQDFPEEWFPQEDTINAVYVPVVNSL